MKFTVTYLTPNQSPLVNRIGGIEAPDADTAILRAGIKLAGTRSADDVELADVEAEESSYA